MNLGIDTAEPDQKLKLPLSDPPMMTFFLNEGTIITIRGSGTEPKLKYYVEAFSKSGETKDQLSARHAHLVRAVEVEWLGQN